MGKLSLNKPPFGRRFFFTDGFHPHCGQANPSVQVVKKIWKIWKIYPKILVKFHRDLTFRLIGLKIKAKSEVFSELFLPDLGEDGCLFFPLEIPIGIGI